MVNGFGIIFFKRREIPCPDCYPEVRGYQLNPFFESCADPDHPEHTSQNCSTCSSREGCKPGELIPCETCLGWGRIPL